MNSIFVVPKKKKAIVLNPWKYRDQGEREARVII